MFNKFTLWKVILDTWTDYECVFELVQCSLFFTQNVLHCVEGIALMLLNLGIKLIR